MSTPLPSTQKHKNEKMTHLAKSSLPVKRRYFLTTNQLFYFRFDIDKVIRNTYTHTCMETAIHISFIQRYTHIHAYMHEFIYTNKFPPHYPIGHRQWENDIHSFIPDFYSAFLSPLLLRGAPDHSRIDSTN